MKEEIFHSLRSEFQHNMSETLRSIQGALCAKRVVPPADAAAQLVPAMIGMPQTGGSAHAKIASPQMTPRSQHSSTVQTFQASVQTIQASVAQQSTPRSPLLLTRPSKHAEVPSAGPRSPGSQVRRLASRDTPRSATFALPSGGSLGTPCVPAVNVPGRSADQWVTLLPSEAENPPVTEVAVQIRAQSKCQNEFSQGSWRESTVVTHANGRRRMSHWQSPFID